VFTKSGHWTISWARWVRPTSQEGNVAT
jgi:hypothetical protein